MYKPSACLAFFLQAQVIGDVKARGWKGALCPLRPGGAQPADGTKNDAQHNGDLKTGSPSSPVAAGRCGADVAQAAPAAAASSGQQPGRPPKRTLAEDWASLLLALRAPVVWSGAVWRMFYCTCLNGELLGWCAGSACVCGLASRLGSGWAGVLAGLAWLTSCSPWLGQCNLLALSAFFRSTTAAAGIYFPCRLHLLHTAHPQVAAGSLGQWLLSLLSTPLLHINHPDRVGHQSAAAERGAPGLLLLILPSHLHWWPPYPQATSDTKVVLLSAVPWACAALTHLVNSMHSQHVGERRWHICVPWMAGAICLYCLAAAAAAGKVSAYLLRFLLCCLHCSCAECASLVAT